MLVLNLMLAIMCTTKQMNRAAAVTVKISDYSSHLELKKLSRPDSLLDLLFSLLCVTPFSNEFLRELTVCCGFSLNF